jgi:threonylcarbamoyladenosine tRNA methylthiotransferase MtaB
LHVFSYSERENTFAKKMNGSVPIKTRKNRSQILRNLSSKKKNKFYIENLKTSRPTLIESRNKKETLNGYTDNYIKVEIPYKENLKNKIIEINMEALNNNGNIKGVLI